MEVAAGAEVEGAVSGREVELGMFEALEALEMLEVRGGGVPKAKREAMQSWMWVSRTLSPGGSSVPQTGHSSSSRTCLRGRGCGAGSGGGCVVFECGIGGKGALLLL